MRTLTLEDLADRYPWPAERPALDEDWQGWFGPDHEKLLRTLIGPETRLIAELGSWKGLSTRFLAEEAPNATVIAIDHWQGSPEMLADPARAAEVERSYEQFLANMWPYKERVIPLREYTRVGLARLYDYGLTPDLIYVDASHDYSSVTNELFYARALCPGAALAGDDYSRVHWPGVVAAVDNFARAWDYDLVLRGIAWALIKRGDSK